ncbi:MAG: hypothetical protein MSA50_07570 [Veillonellaceae bacterium]|nr:hypothetical protein [Veillonellaceae bacterium]MDD6697410.1 hypothetical protein [Veillonellaceae bacterium]
MQNVKIRVAKQPIGTLACKEVTLRERVLRFFLGKPHGVMVFVPEESLKEVVLVSEGKGQKGDMQYGQGKTSRG